MFELLIYYVTMLTLYKLYSEYYSWGFNFCFVPQFCCTRNSRLCDFIQHVNLSKCKTRTVFIKKDFKPLRRRKSVLKKKSWQFYPTKLTHCTVRMIMKIYCNKSLITVHAKINNANWSMNNNSKEGFNIPKQFIWIKVFIIYNISLFFLNTHRFFYFMIFLTNKGKKPSYCYSYIFINICAYENDKFRKVYKKFIKWKNSM